MSALRAIARPLLAGVFVRGGVDAFRSPEPRAATAAPVLDRVSRLSPKDVSHEAIVRANAAAQVAAAGMLALGVRPRLAGAALAASIVPTTVGGHRFWEHDDPASRAQQQIHFMKNLAILGGLLLVVDGG
jgi:putative oxidoreductase